MSKLSKNTKNTKEAMGLAMFCWFASSNKLFKLI